MDDRDPFVHTAKIPGQRDESLQSHIDAICNRVIKDKQEKYDEDKKQFNMFDEGGEPEEHRAGSDDDDPTHFADPEDEAEDDFANVVIPLIEETQMPDFKKMLTEHAEWYVRNHYTGEDGEAGLEDLIQDFKHSMDVVIDGSLKLEDAKTVAIDALQF